MIYFALPTVRSTNDDAQKLCYLRCNAHAGSGGFLGTVYSNELNLWGCVTSGNALIPIDPPQRSTYHEGGCSAHMTGGLSRSKGKKKRHYELGFHHLGSRPTLYIPRWTTDPCIRRYAKFVMPKG